ncbi:unnamed protein product, partial [Rotaria sp. Silwood2]
CLVQRSDLTLLIRSHIIPPHVRSYCILLDQYYSIVYSSGYFSRENLK